MFATLSRFFRRPPLADLIEEVPDELSRFADDATGLRLDPRLLMDNACFLNQVYCLPLEHKGGRQLVALPEGAELYGVARHKAVHVGIVRVSQDTFDRALWSYYGQRRPEQPKAPWSGGYQFAVRDVEPATEPYPEVRMWDDCYRRFRELRGTSDFGTRLITARQASSHALINAVYLAFCDHRPLVLSPDMLWTTLLQGLTLHVELNPDAMRHRLVRHTGKKRIEISRPDFVPESLENPWDEVMNEFAAAVEPHLQPGVAPRLKRRFSTTGPVEQAVASLCVMDLLKDFFGYAMACICGIPSITLEGTPEDWTELREAVADWREFDLDWWLDALDPILAQFEAASRGQVDSRFWNDIYQHHETVEGYGGPFQTMSGWISLFIPYIHQERNPHFSSPHSPIYANYFPSSLSRASIQLVTPEGSGTIELVGGLLGVEQSATLSLRPKLGWAVHGHEVRDEGKPPGWSQLRPEIRKRY